MANSFNPAIIGLVTDIVAVPNASVSTANTAINNYNKDADKSQTIKDTQVAAIGLGAVTLTSIIDQLPKLSTVSDATAAKIGGPIALAAGAYALANDYSKLSGQTEISAADKLTVLADAAKAIAGAATLAAAIPALTPIALPLALLANITAVAATAGATIASNPEAMSKISDAMTAAENVLRAAEKASTGAISDALNSLGQTVLEAGQDVNAFFDGISKSLDELSDKLSDFMLDISHMNLGDDLADLADKLAHDLAQKLGLLPQDGILKYHLYDPLVLDLDGNGIIDTTVAAKDSAMFDHNNDGIRTATGWVKATDGILVIDRNGDGKINNGSEIFGDSVTLANGTKATNGYQALAEFDTNQDGKITAEDQNFASLKVWKDTNQDGISQTDELFTLDQLGIKSLSLTYQNTNTALTGGNTLAQTGNYETADGQTHTMGDVNFAFNSVYSEYTDHIQLTEAQQQVANLKGAGNLRDLREAAAQSDGLGEILAAYSNASTKTEQMGMLNTLITA